MESGISKARRHWGALLERAKSGEQIVITRYGVPVAVIGPTVAFKTSELDTSGEPEAPTYFKPGA
jgi:prevent-host-death family protein